MLVAGEYSGHGKELLFLHPRGFVAVVTLQGQFSRREPYRLRWKTQEKSFLMTEEIFITRGIRGCISNISYSGEKPVKDRSEYQKVNGALMTGDMWKSQAPVWGCEVATMVY